MDEISVALQLMQLDDNKLRAVVEGAVNKYFEVLYSIASDIYDSCINDYYNQYIPKFYDRHGNLEGFNLYKANEIELNDNGLRLFIDSNQLLKYPGKHGLKKREAILDSVMSGFRGGPLPNRDDWPMDWYTSYPNKYSKLQIWSSSSMNLYDIYNDFIQTVITDTKDIFWGIVCKCL